MKKMFMSMKSLRKTIAPGILLQIKYQAGGSANVFPVNVEKFSR